MDSLTLKLHNYFQNSDNRRPKHSFAPRLSIFIKFNDICVSSSSPKADLRTNFLNVENGGLENVSFSSIVDFK